MSQFCNAFAKFAIITALVLSLVLLGIGALILWKPLLVAKFLAMLLGGGCASAGVLCLISLVIAGIKH